MKSVGENRLIPIDYILRDGKLTNLARDLSKKWIIDFGYTNALNQDCALLLCKVWEL